MRRFLIPVLALGLAFSTSAFAAPAQRHKLVVYFSSWSAAVDPDAQKAISEAAKWLREHPQQVVNVAGYASTVGGKRANALLSDLRAQVVVDQLKSEGVPDKIIRLLPKGATTYAESPMESRRVEIFIDPK